MISGMQQNNEKQDAVSSRKNVKKNWCYLFSANFFGILNDNFMKFCIVYMAASWSFLNTSQLTTAVSAALVIPYLAFSPLSGKLAVKYAKHKIFRICKLLEFPIVAIAAAGFYCQNVWLALSAVLLMGIQSCMYSPAKYGLIKEIGGKEGVNFGSGVFETMSFLAILTGTFLSSFLSDHYIVHVVVGLLFLFAFGGYWMCRSIRVEEYPEAGYAGTVNPIKFIKNSFLYAQPFGVVNAGIFGEASFWMIAGILQMNLLIHCTQTLAQSNTISGIVMTVAAVGIAIGCTITGKLCNIFKRKTLILIGLTGMILCITAIIVFNPPVVICAVLVFIIAFMGGCYEVPCLSLIQKADTGQKNGDMLAYMNLMTFIFVLLGSLLFFAVTQLTEENSIAVFMAIDAVCCISLVFFARKQLS